jgi:DNA polymerase
MRGADVLPANERLPKVPASLVDLLERAACHRDPYRNPLMYRLLWRVVHERKRLLADAADDDVIMVTRLARAVDRASHKMKAFVRFREVTTAEGRRYFARFTPEHDVLQRTAPFFAERFGTMVWAIVTPDGGVRWDRKTLCYFDVDRAGRHPPEDAAEALWLTYYESIFNPARLNVAMMHKEMPVSYWKHLPEAARIPQLVADAMPRAGRMIERTVAARAETLSAIEVAVAPNAMPTKPLLDACRRCPLSQRATQGVPGAGPRTAALMLVGEQPGDEEDLQGRPFVGPAGRLLRELLDEAGLAPAQVFMTNAVKHFFFEPRGKRRIHKTPLQRHIAACHAWLEGELARVHPAVIVTLGATALAAVHGGKIAIATARTRKLASPEGTPIVATYHPSAVLRAPDHDARVKLRATLLADLERAARRAGGE